MPRGARTEFIGTPCRVCSRSPTKIIRECAEEVTVTKPLGSRQQLTQRAMRNQHVFDYKFAPAGENLVYRPLIRYAWFRSRANDAVLRVYDKAGNERMRIIPQRDATGEALESDEAAASEYIFLRTASVLASPSARLRLFPSPWLLPSL